mmetsp:Transcript_37867/g.88538  ORF Transcript_37867/g.88538 Transcript_37867/m.88538 type:complete len:229 (-) Transcript_37867:188-874(-)
MAAGAGGTLRGSAGGGREAPGTLKKGFVASEVEGSSGKTRPTGTAAREAAASLVSIASPREKVMGMGAGRRALSVSPTPSFRSNTIASFADRFSSICRRRSSFASFTCRNLFSRSAAFLSLASCFSCFLRRPSSSLAAASAALRFPGRRPRAACSCCNISSCSASLTCTTRLRSRASPLTKPPYLPLPTRPPPNHALLSSPLGESGEPGPPRLVAGAGGRAICFFTAF